MLRVHWTVNSNLSLKLKVEEEVSDVFTFFKVCCSVNWLTMLLKLVSLIN